MSAGLAKQTTAETRNAPPKSAHAQRIGTSSVARAMFSMPAPRNMSPTRMPTVVTDAWSNWRTTSEMATHAIPATSSTHQ